MELENFSSKRVYLVGIKGAGMAGLAQLFRENGWQVSGSDEPKEFFTDKILKRAKIKVYQGFSEKNLPLRKTLFVASSAYLLSKSQNPEILALRRQKKKIFSYAEALGWFFNQKFGLAVAGTHGKSTTTALLGEILVQADFKPTVLVGAKVLNWSSNFLFGKDKFFLIEADEYREAFLAYRPKIIIINSLEYEHPDYFSSFDDYVLAFRKFIQQLPEEGVVICPRKVRAEIFRKERGEYAESFTPLFGKIQDNIISLVIDILNKRGELKKSFLFLINQKKKRLSLSLSKHNCTLSEAVTKSGQILFPEKEKNFSFPLSGIYLQNAALATATALFLGIRPEIIKKTFLNFKGLARRFEIIKKTKKYILISDYAHHPTAIQKTIQLARLTYPQNKILAIFQPHTFSRTEKFFKQFAQSLSLADQIILLPIFASAREKKGRISSLAIVKELEKRKKPVFYLRNKQGIKSIIKKAAFNHWIILLLGAGDIDDLKRFF